MKLAALGYQFITSFRANRPISTLRQKSSRCYRHPDFNLISSNDRIMDMKRNGGQLLVDCLLALGATKCFGVPGESYLAVLDALHDTCGSLDFVMCRNEGGAAFMATAYGKLTSKPGICFVTRGPGATNAS